MTNTIARTTVLNWIKLLGKECQLESNSYANECLTTLSLTVFTQRNFVADFLQAKCDFTPKMAVLGLATYIDHLRLIGKPRSGFPISVNLTFFR